MSKFSALGPNPKTQTKPSSWFSARKIQYGHGTAISKSCICSKIQFSGQSAPISRYSRYRQHRSTKYKVDGIISLSKVKYANEKCAGEKRNIFTGRWWKAENDNENVWGCFIRDKDFFWVEKERKRNRFLMLWIRSFDLRKIFSAGFWGIFIHRK